MEGSDACFAGIVSLEEAPDHPHNAARQSFVTLDGVVQPAPAPRFSRTPSKIQEHDFAVGAHNAIGLADWGFTPGEIDALKGCGAL